MKVLFTILVTFFAGMGSRTWNRFCRDECGSGYQPDAYHISWDGAVYGGRDCAVF